MILYGKVKHKGKIYECCWVKGKNPITITHNKKRITLENYQVIESKEIGNNTMYNQYKNEIK